jgi:hypothetical protein
VFSNFWKNWKRVTAPSGPKSQMIDSYVEEMKKGYAPVPIFNTHAEAVIQLPYATVSIAPNFDVHNPKIVLTVSEIFDARDRKVNVTRIELTSKEAGRLSRAMNSAADWANGVEER